jgi:TPR repeat protein
MSNLLLNGFATALFLGFYYLNGKLKDKPLALDWLQRACDANNHHSGATYRHLATCLMDLEVGKQDYKAAYIHNERFRFLWEHYSKEKMRDNQEGSKASIYLTTKNKVMQNLGADDLESAKSELKLMKNNYVFK